jgi:hypothetical protein
VVARDLAKRACGRPGAAPRSPVFEAKARGKDAVRGIKLGALLGERGGGNLPGCLRALEVSGERKEEGTTLSALRCIGRSNRRMMFANS